MRMLDWQARILFLILIFQRALSFYKSAGAETICDKQLEEILIKQGLSPFCDTENNGFVVNGNQKNYSLSLEFKNITSSQTRVAFANFTELIFKNMVFEKFENGVQTYFAIIDSNEKVIFENVVIIGERESNLQYLMIRNNQDVQFKNVSIRFYNGYFSNILKQILIILEDNDSATIQNYDFLYNQSDKGLKESDNLINGISIINTNIHIANTHIEISYMKYTQPNYFQANVPSILIIEDVIGKKNYTLSQIFATFNSLPSFFEISNLNPSFSIINSNGIISNVTINNSHSRFAVFLFNLGGAIVENFNFLNSFVGSSDSSSDNSFIMMILSTYCDLKTNKITVRNSTVYQQYLIGQNLQGQVSLDIENSFWKNSMMILTNQVNLNIFSKGSNFEGQFPLIYIDSQQQNITLSLHLELEDFVKTQNGLIYIKDIIQNRNSANLNNLNIRTKKNTELQLNAFGLIKIFSFHELLISDSIFIHDHDQIFSSQNGGIFNIQLCDSVIFRNITASGFKITGSGSFAFLDVVQKVDIQNSSFDKCLSFGVGGTFYLDSSQLHVVNTTISNSASGLIGGGIYNSEYIQQNKFQNATFKNCYSQIGGALAINHESYQISGITFENNYASLQDNDISYPIQGLTLVQFGEFNPQLIDKLQNIKREFSAYQIKEEQYLVFQNTDVNIMYYISFNLTVGSSNLSYSQLNCQDLPQTQQTSNLKSYNKDDDNNNKQCVDEPGNTNLKPKCNRLKKQQFECKNNLISLFNRFGSQEIILSIGLNQRPIFQIKKKPENYFIKDVDFPNQTDFYILFQNQNYLADSIQFDLNLLKQRLVVIMNKQKECADGQIKIDKGSYSFCKYCQDFQVRLNSTKCQICSPSLFQNCSGYISELKPGYYRPEIKNKKLTNNQLDNSIFNYNDDSLSQFFTQATSYSKSHNLENEDQQDQIILPCSYLPQFCQGGEKYGDKSCEKSHVGPICLGCDRNAQIWSDNYTSSNSYECNPCNSYLYNLILTITIFLVGLLFILLLDIIQLYSYKSFKKNVDDIKYRLSASVYFKLALFFLQITNMCSYYQSPNLIKFLYTFQVQAFNPISNSYLNFFECFIIQVQPNWYSAHAFLIIQAISPFALIAVYLLLRNLIVYCYQRHLSKKQQKEVDNQKQQQQQSDNENNEKENSDDDQDDEQKKQQLSHEENMNQQLVDENKNIQNTNKSLNLVYFTNRNTQIQIFFNTINSLSLQIISQLLAGITCSDFEKIGSYSNLDLTISCQDQTQIQIRNFFSIPMLIIYVLIIPAFQLKKLINYRQNLDDEEVFQEYGFLYSAYQNKYFFWEFVRYIAKVLLFVCIYLLIPNNSQIGYYVIPVLVIYSSLLIKFQPFKIDGKIEKQRLQEERIYGVGHTHLEIIVIVSGIGMLMCYMINDTYIQNKYGKLKDYASQVYALIGTVQAVILFIILVCKFVWYFAIRKLKIKYKQKKQNKEQDQLNLIQQQTENNLISV